MSSEQLTGLGVGSHGNKWSVLTDGLSAIDKWQVALTYDMVNSHALVKLGLLHFLGFLAGLHIILIDETSRAQHAMAASLWSNCKWQFVVNPWHLRSSVTLFYFPVLVLLGRLLLPIVSCHKAHVNVSIFSLQWLMMQLSGLFHLEWWPEISPQSGYWNLAENTSPRLKQSVLAHLLGACHKSTGKMSMGHEWHDMNHEIK